MEFDRKHWKNLPSRETPITAEELNRIEKLVEEVANFKETTINGKSGVITKLDILALGIPVAKGDYDDWNNMFIGRNRPQQVEDIVL